MVSTRPITRPKSPRLHSLTFLVGAGREAYRMVRGTGMLNVAAPKGAKSDPESFQRGRCIRCHTPVSPKNAGQWRTVLFASRERGTKWQSVLVHAIHKRCLP